MNRFATLLLVAMVGQRELYMPRLLRHIPSIWGAASGNGLVGPVKNELACVSEERNVPWVSRAMQMVICGRRRASQVVFHSGDVPVSAIPAESLLYSAQGVVERACAEGAQQTGLLKKGLGLCVSRDSRQSSRGGRRRPPKLRCALEFPVKRRQAINAEAVKH